MAFSRFLCCCNLKLCGSHEDDINGTVENTCAETAIHGQVITTQPASENHSVKINEVSVNERAINVDNIKNVTPRKGPAPSIPTTENVYVGREPKYMKEGINNDLPTSQFENKDVTRDSNETVNWSEYTNVESATIANTKSILPTFSRNAEQPNEGNSLLVSIRTQLSIWNNNIGKNKNITEDTKFVLRTISSNVERQNNGYTWQVLSKEQRKDLMQFTVQQISRSTNELQPSKPSTESDTRQRRFIHTKPDSLILQRIYKERLKLKYGKKRIIKNQEIVEDILENLKLRWKLYIQPTEVYTLKLIPENTKTYNFVLTKFRNSKFNKHYKIIKIEKLWNPYLMAQYMLNKKKLGDKFREHYLYHGTGPGALPGIFTNNFDWRMTYDHWYGKGVYFANNPWYASHYSKNNNNSLDLIMIVATVLVENADIPRGYGKTIIPDEGQTTTNKNGEVIVKYVDGCFYPEFVVYYQPKVDLEIEFDSGYL